MGKSKKSHKSKKRQRGDSSSSDASGSDDEPRSRSRTKNDFDDDDDDWVEAGSATTATTATATTTATTNSNDNKATNSARADWMLKPPPKRANLSSTTPSAAEAAAAAAKAAEDAKNKPHPRELNTYLFKTASGAPEGDDEAATRVAVPSAALKFGDGGASWRRRAVQRAREQADAEGRSLESVLQERFGDEYREYMPHARDARTDERRGNERAPAREERGYLRDVHREATRFARPTRDDDDDDDDDHGRRRGNVDEFGRVRPPTTAPTTAATPATPATTVATTPTTTSAATTAQTSTTSSSSNVSSSRRDAPTSVDAQSMNPAAPPPPMLITAPPVDLNKLQAALLRAELRGDAAQANAVRAQIAAASAQSSKRSNAAVATAVGLASKVDGESDANRKRAKPTETHDRKTGERLRYFADDDEKVDLATLVRREKSSDGSSYDRAYAKTVLANNKFDAERELDERGESLFEAKKKSSTARPSDKALAAVNAAAGGRAMPNDQCMRCVQSERGRSASHFVVARGTRAYLALPTRPLIANQCLIVPFDHTPSVSAADEDVYTEMRNFQKCVLRMFDADDCDVVFFETAASLHKSRHTAIECVPMSRRDAAAAPGYFRHALNESEREDEWSQHKKVLEVPAAKGVRRAVPPQFPYFYVQFGLGDGLAHIIDSRQDFGDQFARGVLAGLLELDDDWMARPKPESRHASEARVGAFRRKFAPYDWTAVLRGQADLDQINSDAAATTSRAPVAAKPTARDADAPGGMIGALRVGSTIDNKI